MPVHNKVVWSDGLFIKPHHFQQQALYQDYQAHSLISAADPYPFGFSSLRINQELLSLGKFGLEAGSGVMPDGTVFNFPEEDELPQKIDIDEGSSTNEIIYLCLPIKDNSVTEVQTNVNGSGAISRYVEGELAIRDTSSQAGELAAIKVAKVQAQLRMGNENLAQYTKLAIARVREKGADGTVRLDENFFPTMISINASSELRNQLGDLSDGLSKRAQQLATRLDRPEQNGVAEMSDFLLLVALNRYAPLLRHFSQLPNLHPQWLFASMVQLVGEMATFFDEAKFPRDIPRYDHELPENCWPPIFARLRQILSATLSTNALPIALERKQHGYYIAPIHDPELYKNAEFILAVKADVPADRIHREFVKQSKVSSVEDIRKLVHSQLPGIPLELLPTHPRQLPYHAGYSYFRVDRGDPAWQVMNDSEGFAFHIASQFSGLELQFWALSTEQK